MKLFVKIDPGEKIYFDRINSLSSYLGQIKSCIENKGVITHDESIKQLNKLDIVLTELSNLRTSLLNYYHVRLCDENEAIEFQTKIQDKYLDDRLRSLKSSQQIQKEFEQWSKKQK